MINNFKEWAQKAGIRAIKTVCQTAVSLLGVGATGLLDVDWLSVASVSLLAGVISLLTSVAGLPEVSSGDDTLAEEAENAE